MTGSQEDIERRIKLFAQRYDCALEKRLGYGWDGIVISTNSEGAIKGLRYQPLYERERDVYLRLQELAVFKVRGFNVPRLVRFDDELCCVEMTIVRPPFVLDFAGAYLDEQPDYPDDILEAWRVEKIEQFEERWTEVQAVMREFGRMGIYLADIKPGNIEFESCE